MFQTILAQGDGLMNEDAVAINEKLQLYGVIDGVTSLEKLSFQGLSPGKIASLTVKETLEAADSGTLRELTRRANSAIADKMAEYGRVINHPKDRFQCCHAFVQLHSDEIFWTASADCVIYAIGHEVTQIYPLSSGKLENERVKLWQQQFPEDYKAGRWPKEWINLSDDAKSTANQPGGYSVMNGDPLFNQSFSSGSFARQGITHILLTTDGFYDIEALGLELFVRKGLDLDAFLDYMMTQERLDHEKTLYPRVKMHDDKAAVLITL